MSGSPVRRSYEVLRHPEFRRFETARFLSTIATQGQSVAVGWQVYDITGDPLDLGLVGLAQFLPAFGLSIVTGHVADRYDRRGVVMVCGVVMAISSLLLLALASTEAGRALGVHPIYAALFLFGTARAFQRPAGSALLPHTVPSEEFPQAVVIGSTIWEIGTVVGPALGGVLYWLGGGAGGVYAASAALYATAFSFDARLGLRLGRMEKRGASWSTLLAGVRYVFENKLVLGAISLDLFAVLLGGAIALLPAYAKDVLHVGPLGLGALRSAPAAGAIVMAAALAWFPIARKAGSRLLWSVAIFGIATVVFGLSRSFVVSLVALAIAGAFDMVSVVVRQTLVQVATPAEMRGRVSAVNVAFIVASNELGEFESGVTAAWFGLIESVVIGGVGTCLVVAIWAVLFPALRRVDRLTGPADS